MYCTILITNWQKAKYQKCGSVLLKQTAGLLCKCVNVHASVRLLLLAICVLQIVCWNRPASALWNGSHLILFHHVKWQHDMLFYSVTFGCSEPDDCIWCVESPCYYEPLVTVCLWGCCQSRWVMQTCWSLTQCTENCLCGNTFVICFHSRISICSVHYRNIILNTRQIYTKTFLITSSVAWIWNHSNLNVFIVATQCWTQNRNTHQWHITVSSNNVIDDLQCISLFSPQSFSLNTVSSQTLTMRTTHAVYRTGQVSGFIIFGSDLHNARGIKLNLHNSFDYTCY